MRRWTLLFRRRFFRMTLREKGLSLLFVVALVALWYSSQLKRHRSAWANIQLARSEASTQKAWLEQENRVREEYETLMAGIDLASLPTKDEVSSRIDAIVRRNGFTQFSFSQARSEPFAELTFHSIPLTIEKITYEQARAFTQEVRSTLPSVSLERISIRPQARDDQFLDVSFQFKSIEHTK